METFKRKNDIGVEIEYTILGQLNDNNKTYYIYTDFVPDDNDVGMRLYVDLKDNTGLIRLPKEEEKEIIKKFNKELLMYERKQVVGGTYE